MESTKNVWTVFLASTDETFRREIARLLAQIPGRRFVLAGMNGWLAGEFNPAAIDIALFDLDHLPSDAGLQPACERTGVPIIIVAAETDAGRERQAVESGAIDLVARGKLTPFVLERVLQHAARTRNANRRLIGREQQLAAIIEAFDGLIYICSPERRIEYVNDRLRQRNGGEALGAPCHQVMHGLADPCPWCDHGQVLAGGTVRLEVQSPKDGRWYFAVDTPVVREDGTVSKLSMVQDITERKQAEVDLLQAEAELRSLNEDLEWQVASRTLDLQRANSSLMFEISERRQLEEVLRREKEQLETAQGELARAYAELKATQERVLQQEKMASIGQLAAGVAHEINNPMGFIASNLNSLEKFVGRVEGFIAAQTEAVATAAPGEAERLRELRRKLKLDYILTDIRDLIRESLEGADRVKKIVQDLKTFSRRDDGEWRPVDLNECVESTVNMVWNELKYKAALEKELGAIPLTKCNPQQMNQVFMNLLVNAAQAIEKQGTITIRSWAEGGRVHVGIADTGCGIPAESLPRLFEPFYTTKPVGHGTGLGLSISYEIVRKHGGDLRVASEPGEGTTFVVSLPLTEVSADA